MWRDWQTLCAASRLTHQCDNTFAYGMLVTMGLGVGLLGTYLAGDPRAVPLALGVHVPLPMYAVTLRERLEARPTRYVFDWLCETFDSSKPFFADRLSLDDLSQELPSLKLFASPGAASE
jgi:DNA-binding transcriptional LysR family regulator